MERKKLGPRSRRIPRPPTSGGDPLDRLVEQATGFVAVPLSSLRLDTVTGFDLYLRNPLDGRPMLYRGGQLKFSEEHLARLRQSNVRELFVSAADHGKYLRYLEKNLSQILADPRLPASERARTLYASATTVVRDVLSHPGEPENLARVRDLAESTVSELLKGGEHLGTLLGIMSFDYQTYTHSVNVCVFGVALARRIGMSAAELNELGLGLLLHDVGKAAVDPAILSKEGPLTAEETAIVRSHPELGMRMLAPLGALPPTIRVVVLQHHEKCSGGGYPHGLTDRDIHLYAKIATLADVFDALTTRRCYGQAVQSFEAIRIMQKEMADSFNPELLRELILMMNSTEIYGPARPSREQAA